MPPRTGYPGGFAVGDNLAGLLLGGVAAMQTLRQSGAVVAAETVTIGGDVYRAANVMTDSTKNVGGGELAATSAVNNPQATITMLAHGLKQNDLIRVDTEIMLVLQPVGPNQIRVLRGACNTSVATHADAADIFTEAALGGGGLPVGLQGTLTNAVFTDSLIWSINNLGKEKIKAYDLDVDTVAVVACDKPAKDGGAPIAGLNTTATTETLTNGAFDAATLAGGRNPEMSFAMKIVPTANEVTEGKIVKYFPFTPVLEDVLIRVTSTGAAKIYSGAATISGPQLTLDNAGGTPWAATDTIVLTIRPS